MKYLNSSRKSYGFISLILSMVLLMSFAIPIDVRAEGSRDELETAISNAREELETAKTAQLEAKEKEDRGSLGFIEYMLNKTDITEKMRYDLQSAKRVIEKALEENFSEWVNGENAGFPSVRNDKVTALGDKNDAISLANTDVFIKYTKMVNKIREEDDIYVGPVKRNPGKTNFYFMAVAQTGADRGAGLKRHSLMQVSCENLAWGQNPYCWLSEKANFKKAMEVAEISSLSSEEDIRKVESVASEKGYTIGHYTNLFWAVDQLMGVGFTNYGGTCYNASKQSNYSDRYAIYTIDDFEKLFNEYYATVDPVKYQELVDEKQSELDALLDQYYSSCPGHEFGEKTTVAPTCIEQGYDKRVCSKCGYTEKTNIVAPMGHDIVDGVCSRCDLKTVKEIRQINWKLDRVTNTTNDMMFEVGSKIDFSILYNSASDYKWDDEFIIDISDPSIIKYTPSSNCTGKMEMLNVGKCVVDIYPKENPSLKRTVKIDVSDVGGHAYSLSPLVEGENHAVATCSKCGDIMEVDVPSIYSVRYSKDGNSFEYGNLFSFDADSTGYISVTLSNVVLNFGRYGLDNNSVVIESEDESIISFDSGSGTSRYKAKMNTGKHGMTKVAVYPKYAPFDRHEFTVVVKGSEDVPVSSITLDKNRIDLYLKGNNEGQLNATVAPSDAFIKDVKWQSGNTDFVTVDNNGIVKGVKKGSMSVIATAMDGSGVRSDRCQVNIWDKWDTPNVSASDFTVTENSIASNLSGDYLYRIKTDDSWGNWISYNEFDHLKSDTEYEIGVKKSKDYYEYMDESDEIIVLLKTKKFSDEKVDEEDSSDYKNEEDNSANKEKKEVGEGKNNEKDFVPNQSSEKKYIKSDGQFARSEWISLNGKMYYYNSNGVCDYPGTLMWKSNSTGWWVEDTLGWYPTSSWQKIDGVWYYFKPDGYMAMNEYYNGYWFNSDGSWDEQYYLTWKQNTIGWWVEDISGWWPSNKWLKIDGCWYYFNSSGYMVTNQYIDGWWIGADGVCR